MKIPLIWLKDYLETPKSASELAASFTQLGLMLDKPLDKSNVLDLEHRMDRADWLSILGCARDLSAFENIPLVYPKSSGKAPKKPSREPIIPITVRSPYVRRFTTRTFRGLKVDKSPAWLRKRLVAYGLESKNNLVDITNFVMVEYGQPMHAQDLAKLPGRDITIRPGKAGEKLTTILGTEIKLDSDTFILTSGGQPTVIGGIVGGKNTSVTDSTTDIILDAGNYDQKVIRKTSRRLKIINESVARYDKFLDPRATEIAINRATELILNLCGGTVYENDDYYPAPVAPQTQSLRYSRLALLSGMEIDKKTVKRILTSLEYAIVEEDEHGLTLEIPYFRTDIEVEDDLISDILRIHNYVNVPTRPLTTAVPPDITPPIYRFEDRLRDLLVAQGAHEHITSSLVTANGQGNEVVLANALSTDQNALRTSLEPSLAHVLSTYKKHKQSKIPVFEIGKVFSKAGGKYLEGRLLTVMDTSDSLTTLLFSLGIAKYSINPQHEILVGKRVVGTIDSTSYTLVTNLLMTLASNYSNIISEFSHPQSRDISLLAPTNLTYADIMSVINDLTLSIQSIECKSYTKLKNANNYLLTLIWPKESDITTEQTLILKTLKNKLNVTSKS
jgi:phenylalanyl-tRNA synthetase beta chain